MSNPNWGEIATTTLENRSKSLADNVTKQVALFMRLKERGKRKPFSGGRVILQELEYAENATVNYYSGFETIDTTPQTAFTAAEFQIKQLAGSLTMSGLEELQNAGPEQMIDLLEARVSNLEKTMINKIGADIYSDGTGSSGKQIGGLQLLVPDAPSSGTVGGIDAGTYTWWQSKKYSGVTDGGALVSAANIKRYINELKFDLVRGMDKPDLAVCDNNYYGLLMESMQAIQRVESSKMVEAGFEAIKYQGMDVVLDGGASGPCPANHCYLLNTDYIYYRPHSRREFVVIGAGKREPVNQDAFVRIMAWAGNLTVSNRSLQGVLIA